MRGPGSRCAAPSALWRHEGIMCSIRLRVSMTYRTVNLKPETYERLQTYKVGGMSFDDVVRFLVDRVDPAILHEQARRAVRPEPIRFTKLEASGRSAPRR